MDLGLKNKRAIVTGGTRGIGRAIVDLFAAEGADVAFCARDGAAAEAAAQEVAAASGVKAIGAEVDIADHDRLAAWIGEAVDALGGLDALVVNASALALGGNVDAFRKCFEVDVLGLVVAGEAALPALKASGAGSIVAISSVSAVERSDMQAYGAMKAAQVPIAKGWAVEHAGVNVRANVVSPGTIEFEGGVWGMAKEHAPKMYEDALARNPMGRMGGPEEIARAAVFLSSPAASFVTGTNMIVDGAITRRVQL
ncbi:MAG: SDR family oxidoreductase [Pseudomonadota bacterium]